jgi:hypothetical protein
LKKVAFIFIIGILALSTIASAEAVSGTLPGGTTIELEITAPSDGAVKVDDPGMAWLEGWAFVDEGITSPDTLIVYVLDISYSTIRGDGGTGCGGDQNGDGIYDTVLDCEIAAAKDLNSLAAGLGTGGEVGVVVFGGASTGNPLDTAGVFADVGPAGGEQLVTGPDTDADSSGDIDVEEVLSSIFSEMDGDAGLVLFTEKHPGGDGTNFAAGLSAAVDIVSASSKPNKVILFMSDGLANTGQNVSTVTVPSNVIINTFAVGTVASCTGDPNSLGSLQDIADLGTTGSSCTPVENVADLPDVIPGIIASELTSLEYRVDGGMYGSIPNDNITPDLPADGPVTAEFGYPVYLDPGIHEICVLATGSDGGGSGWVEDCINVTIATISLEPAEATNEMMPSPEHTVTALVVAGDDGGVENVAVDFEITSGPNTGNSATIMTDEYGNASWTYSAVFGLTGLGTDSISAWFTDEQGDTAYANALKHWVDTTPPEAACPEMVNPHGQKVPPAGSTTLPGAKGGQNEDGFYGLNAVDIVDPYPEIYVVDTGSGAVFGPFADGTVIKYTEDPCAVPEMKKMGSDKGRANAVDWHIIGNGDPQLMAVDASGNIGNEMCYVPPLPK